MNAYHQPGVEAGKKAAATVLKTLLATRGALSANAQTAPEIAAALGEDPEAVYHALNHLAANGSARVSWGDGPATDAFTVS